MRGLAAVVLALAVAGCAQPDPGEALPRATLWPPEDGAVAGVGPPEPLCVTACKVRAGPEPNGLTLEGRHTRDGGVHRVALVGRNEGTATLWLTMACGYDPVAETMLDHRGMRLAAREPAPETWSSDDCNACDVAEMVPGAEGHWEATFDGTFWHPDGYPVQARPGTYNWGFAVSAWPSAGCGAGGDFPATATLRFDVVVE